MADKQGLLRAYLDRVVAGDLQGATEYFSDDVVFHWAGRGPLSGDHRGKEEVRETLARYDRLVEASLEPHDMLFSKDHAVVLARVTYRRAEGSLTMNRVVVYHFSDDKISEVWLLDEKQQEADELLS